VPIEIREERPNDIAAIREVNRAFGQEQEGNIVDALRTNQAVSLSLVATLDDRVVGHITYSPLVAGDGLVGAALGPMAVAASVSYRPTLYGITCEWDVPKDVFLVLVLDRAKADRLTGLAKYRDEFSTVA
jgi:predicted N-acetyltransferase YhbS